MRAIIQRVRNSSVSVDGEIKGSIGKGYNVLLGVMDGDTEAQAELLASKIAKLRVFEDENGKMNKSVLDIDGEILAISQFTLCADCKKGNRPSFTDSEEPQNANRLYELYCDELVKNGEAALGTPTFFPDIDKLLVGMGNSDLVLVGARPGMGKTSFCLNIASQVALKTKKAVAEAEKIMAEMKDVTTFDQAKALANVVTDTVKHITFSAPVFVGVTTASEPVVPVNCLMDPHICPCFLLYDNSIILVYS